VMLPCYHWNRSIVVTPEHPLASRGRYRLRAGAVSAGDLYLRLYRPLRAGYRL
jgi:hypothetical protein